jgi:hypothetical protein
MASICRLHVASLSLAPAVPLAAQQYPAEMLAGLLKMAGIPPMFY